MGDIWEQRSIWERRELQERKWDQRISQDLYRQGHIQGECRPPKDTQDRGKRVYKGSGNRVSEVPMETNSPQGSGRNKKRKHPMGPRGKRRKTVAKRRKWEAGLDLVVSEVPLTHPQRSVLSKGRSFVPGPPSSRPLTLNLSSSLEALEKEINSRFSDSLTPSINPTYKKLRVCLPPQLPRLKTNKNPPQKMPGLRERIKEEETQILEACKRKTRPNLKREEISALEELKRNPNIVIKKADKDGALVVLKIESYRAMGQAHLRDENTYKPLLNPQEELQRVQEEGKRLVSRFYCLDSPTGKRSSFSAAQRDALLAHKASIPHWYILPKTHKKMDEETGTWPGRPVLSGCCAPTRPVDRLLTTFLSPLLELLPERLQDTTHFLRKLREAPRLEGEIYLFSFDIVSLYPSIPQEEAAWVVANFYEKNFGYVQGRLKDLYNITAPPPYLIQEGIEHILSGTLLRFDNKFYQQMKGTAIGASVSVAVAEIFVHVSIEQKRKEIEKQPILFYRYIDDIFGVFQGTEEDLQKYYRELNQFHPDLRFTVEFDKNRLPFLDTTVYVDKEGFLQTTVYHKPSNTHQYLHFQSSHHPNLKKSLPFSQGIRVKRIVSDPEHLEIALNEMFSFFRARGYNEKILELTKNRLDKIPRETLLEFKRKGELNRLIFPMLYSQNIAGPLRKSINQIWEWTQERARDTPWEASLNGPPPMIAWKKDKTIAEKLIRAEFPSPLLMERTALSST